MSRRHALIAGGALLPVVLTAVLVLRCGDGDGAAGESPMSRLPEEAADGEEGLAAEIFFPGAGGKLYPEERRLPAGLGTPEERAGALLGELLSGPRSSALVPPLPDSVALGAAVFNAAERIVVVDFRSAEEGPPPSGSQKEMMTIYSVVNSVLLNLPEAEGVVLLWNGRQAPSFAGHLDNVRPFRAKPQLIAQRAEPAAAGGSPR